MALSRTISWEVRTTGNDNNGGGFNTSSAGTDYSQQNSPHVTFNGLTISGAFSSGTTILITGYVVSAADIGNILRITGGTNYTVGNYQINSVNTLTNTWSVDRNCSTVGALGMTGVMGGGFLTIAHGLAAISTGDQKVYVQSGTYNITAALLPNTSGGSDQTGLIGYITNHSTIPTGTSRPLVSTGSNAINGITFTTSPGWNLQNIRFDSTSNGVIGLSTTSAVTQVYNCKFSGFATGISSSAVNGYFYSVEVAGASTAGVTLTASAQFVGCWIHDNTCVGITNSTTNSFLRLIYCLISNCTGAGSDGILNSVEAAEYIGNTIYANGRDGIRSSNSAGMAAVIALNNIFSSNGGFGFNISTASTYNSAASINYNGYYNNTSGATNNLTIGPNSATLSQNPFTNAAGNDFSLNTTAGGGAALRNAGFPGSIAGLPTPLGYNDIGVYRHQDATTVTNNLYVLDD